MTRGCKFPPEYSFTECKDTQFVPCFGDQPALHNSRQCRRTVRKQALWLLALFLRVGACQHWRHSHSLFIMRSESHLFRIYLFKMMLLYKRYSMHKTTICNSDHGGVEYSPDCGISLILSSSTSFNPLAQSVVRWAATCGISSGNSSLRLPPSPAQMQNYSWKSPHCVCTHAHRHSLMEKVDSTSRHSWLHSQWLAVPQGNGT